MGRTSDADKRLTSAALALMWEESYGAVSVDDICKRAEVKKGSFYYFFESKSVLAVAALDEMARGKRAVLDECFSPLKAPLERIRACCEATYLKQVELKAAHGKVLGCPLCSVGAEICNQDALICAKIREIMAMFAGYWETAIRDAQREGLIAAGDAAAKARCVLAYYEGLLAQARLHNDVEILKDLAAQILSHLHVRTPATKTDAEALVR